MALQSGTGGGAPNPDSPFTDAQIQAANRFKAFLLQVGPEFGLQDPFDWNRRWGAQDLRVFGNEEITFKDHIKEAESHGPQPFGFLLKGDLYGIKDVRTISVRERIKELYLAQEGAKLEDILIFESGILEVLYTSSLDPPKTGDPKWDAFVAKHPTVGMYFKPTQVSDTDEVLTQAQAYDKYRQGERPNEKPSAIQAHECRIGITKFAVPPLAINVTQTFKQNILSNRALRSDSNPKFASGHSETIITIKLYFPNEESIWGYGGSEGLGIDWEDPGVETSLIDERLNSLRGLIAQFRATPFLPIENVYLNYVHNIHAVVLGAMSIETLEDFPFCLGVTLTLYKFNHRLFLPQISNFNNAIHWGRFRQLVGRKLQQIDDYTSLSWLKKTAITPMLELETPEERRARHRARDEIRDRKGSINARPPAGIIDDIPEQPGLPTSLGLISDTDFNTSGLPTPSSFHIYHPEFVPSGKNISSNRDKEFRTAAAVDARESAEPMRGWWTSLLSLFGIDAVEIPTSTEFDDIFFDQDSVQDSLATNYYLLQQYLVKHKVTWMHMDRSFLQKFVSENLRNIEDDELREKSEADLWRTILIYLLLQFQQDPDTQDAVRRWREARGLTTVLEWELPMKRLELSRNTVCTGMTLSMFNTLAPIQLQQQPEPAYQHLGGGDIRCDLRLVVHGEEDLRKLRQTFDMVQGFQLSENQVGVVGFFGFKSLITSLVGFKYALPLNFQVDTIPGIPHAYTVNLSLIDFDIFQQKRELPSTEQMTKMRDLLGNRRNPILRLKQLWSALSCYPDIPLAIHDREDGNKIVGWLEPDFYFRAFLNIDDDTVSRNKNTGWRKEAVDKSLQPTEEELNSPEWRKALGSEKYRIRTDDNPFEPNTVFQFGELGDDGRTKIRFGTSGITVTGPGATGLPAPDDPGSDKFDVLEQATGVEKFDHLVEITAMAVRPEILKGMDPGKLEENFQELIRNLQYKDNRGRMARAFPTYQIWLIDDAGKVLGVKLTDNFYGLQSLLDLQVLRSQDAMEDTAVASFSNLYGKLSTPHADMIASQEGIYGSFGALIANQINFNRRISTGLGQAVPVLDTIQIMPGVRMQIRVGYSANPNNLETIFNGTITDVQVGDVLNVIAQSDGRELGGIVNSRDPKGTTGTIDGSFSNLSLSEPRDMMLQLLTMGASKTREFFAHGMQGRIFGESRFGIKNFGFILYTLSEAEKERQRQFIEEVYENFANPFTQTTAAGTTKSILHRLGWFAGPSVWNIVSKMKINLATRQDYEIFRRNIYPGNGLGVAAFASMDPLDEEMSIATMLGEFGDKRADRDAVILSNSPSYGLIQDHGKVRPFGETALSRALGFASKGTDDDFGIFDEVAFKAETYGRTVWDLFVGAAALMPNYIVAVRPWEHRSTVFYGKPGWRYTSGVWPVTFGYTEDNGPGYVEPDEKIHSLLLALTKAVEAEKQGMGEDQLLDILASLNASGTVSDPGDYVDLRQKEAGISITLSQIESLPLKKNIPNKAPIFIPSRSGYGMIELHLKTHGEHDTSYNVPSKYRYPNHMTYINGTKQEHAGAFGYEAGGKGLPPQIEKWYIAMRWEYVIGKGQKADYYGKKVLVYNKRTRKACVCAIAEWGPHTNTNRILGLSPEAWVATGSGRKKDNGPIDHNGDGIVGDEFVVGWAPEYLPLGPVSVARIENFEADTGNPKGDDEEAAETGKDCRGFDFVPDELKAKMRLVSDQELKSEDEGVLDTQPIIDRNVSKYCKVAHQIWDEFKVHGKNRFGFKIGEGVHQDGKMMLVLFWDKLRNVTLDPDPDKAQEIFNQLQEIKQMQGDILGDGSNPRLVKNILKKAGVTDQDIVDVVGRLFDEFVRFLDENDQKYAWVITVADRNDGLGGQHWNFERHYKLFNKIYRDGYGVAEAEQWMIENSHPGDWDAAGFTQVKEVLGTIGNAVQQTAQTLNRVASGLWSLLGTRFLQMNASAALAMMEERQSNILSEYYNDSVYNPNDPLDNPFTREYGEPVLEIREPFSKYHVINSFNHIISNSITVSAADVYNVVTAHSTNGDPVTVYADKSIDPAYQREKIIQTGLVFDTLNVFDAFKSLGRSTLRWLHKNVTTGNSDALSAKRIALYHLKESLKTMYRGEILCLGMPEVRPFDQIYLVDTYEEIQGTVEAGQVIHSLSPDTGFTTTIIPRLNVTVIDPASYGLRKAQEANLRVQEARNFLRNKYRITADDFQGLQELQRQLSDARYIKATGPFYQTHTQFTGGGWLMAGTLTGRLTAGLVSPAGAIGLWAGHKVFNWWRENFVEQQSVIVDFLNHRGRPLQAGMNGQKGIAVGTQRYKSLFGGALKVEIPEANNSGHLDITLNDLLGGLGWTEIDVMKYARDASIAHENTKAQHYRLLDSSKVGRPEVRVATVTEVTDGDTIKVKLDGGKQDIIRLLSINTPEISTQSKVGEAGGDLAKAFTESRLLNKKVVLRVPHKTKDGSTITTDSYGRTLAYVFVVEDDRTVERLRLVAANPDIEWNYYDESGNPWTFNWELIIKGYARVLDVPLARNYEELQDPTNILGR